MFTRHEKIAAKMTTSAIIRFILLSIVSGFAIGLLAIFVMCLGSCGAYEILYAIGISVGSAGALFAALSFHLLLNANKSLKWRARQASIQWKWFRISGLVFVLALSTLLMLW